MFVIVGKKWPKNETFEPDYFLDEVINVIQFEYKIKLLTISTPFFHLKEGRSLCLIICIKIFWFSFGKSKGKYKGISEWFVFMFQGTIRCRRFENFLRSHVQNIIQKVRVLIFNLQTIQSKYFVQDFSLGPKINFHFVFKLAIPGFTLIKLLKWRKMWKYLESRFFPKTDFINH